jgi:hypothetical protein
MNEVFGKMQSDFAFSLNQLVQDSHRIFTNQEAQHKRREEILLDQV